MKEYTLCTSLKHKAGEIVYATLGDEVRVRWLVTGKELESFKGASNTVS